MLKEKLLNLGIFIENEYFYKYVNLITDNLGSPRIPCKTQSHHIIPRFYYHYNKIKTDNSKNNKVNLFYSDHILAHYYLFFCLNNERYRIATRYAIDIILGHKNFPESETNILENLPDIQNFYEESRKLASKHNPMRSEQHKLTHDKKMQSNEVRKKISNSMKAVRANTSNYINIRKDNKGKRINPKDLQYYLSNGWELGVKNKGYIKLHKDGHETAVPSIAVKDYLDQGYELGGSPGRISENQRLKLDASHFKEVHCIDLEGTEIARFNSLVEADFWWYNNGYGTVKRKKPANYKALSNMIKKSAVENVYIENIKWIYKEVIDNDKVNTN